MTNIFKIEIAGYEIELHQVTPSSFCVVYGEQVSAGLTYSQAAEEIGGCILHALTCEGKIEIKE